ncbi:hypothetical protein MG293_020407 [Ovis ammon polii]|uniref:Phospholipid/glycerol acyltransferase domain-containing protein n=1 Tax=Ovis ammon polii TaxID=230172 RepID=A0AAD4TP65_OVIAM|nr:hypothetical protein MG293_020407 [Ovis ammon polii]
MLLSLVLHMHSVRCVLPAAVLLGSAPTYVLAWGAWRLLSALLPSRFYQAVDDRLYCVYQSMVLFFFENYTGVQILLYGDLPKNKENIIYLANHQSTVDWIIADILAVRQNALGHVRYVLKDGLKWLPLYGCYFSQHGGIYVKRSAKFNENQMRKKLQRYISAGTPMYLVIFPEGTRYNPELTKVISASQAFAAQEGLPILKHVLTPRIKATHVAFDSMKDYLDAVYDVTVAFEGSVDDKGQRKEAPSMAEFLCKECPKIHIHIDRIDKKNIPEEQVSMKRWLHERFEIKDKGRSQQRSYLRRPEKAPIPWVIRRLFSKETTNARSTRDHKSLCEEAAPGNQNLLPISALRHRETRAAQRRLAEARGLHSHPRALAGVWMEPLSHGGAPESVLRGEGRRRAGTLPLLAYTAPRLRQHLPVELDA